MKNPSTPPSTSSGLKAQHKIIFSKPVGLDLEKCRDGGGEPSLTLLAFLALHEFR